MLGLSPLGPDKVAATRELLVRQNLVFCDGSSWLAHYRLIVVVVGSFLAVEPLLFLVSPIPPSAPTDDLPHRRVVVAFADVEAEDLG